MKHNKVNFIKFKPRNEVVGIIDDVVADQLMRLTIEGAAKVVVVDKGAHFYISVVGQVDNKIFSSEALYSKESKVGAPRDWQLGAVDQVLKDFVRQVLMLESR